MNVVIDTNVVISAIFWPGESRQCLVLWAKRRFHLAIFAVFIFADGVPLRLIRIPFSDCIASIKPELRRETVSEDQ